MNKKPPIIRYTARDFNSIKNELVEYSKRYYPDTYSDFNKASFGSLVLDTVSYVGDVLSFYLDYQFNESMISTAVEFDNILKIANQLGYKYQPRSTAYGFVTLYISVPANSNGLGPDTNYLPILLKGTTFASSGGQLFTLLQDVDFSQSTNEIVVAQVDNTTGIPTSYAVKTVGIVQSGFYTQKQIQVGSYERFRQIDLNENNVLEIVSVFDTEGNEYFEVENLSQDVIYRQIPNNNFNSDGVASILKPFPVPRRFTVSKNRSTTILQFGYGSENSDTTANSIEPAENIIELHSKNYYTDSSFDPTNLIKTDKFGIAPSDTFLTISYRKSNEAFSNASAGSIVQVKNSRFKFNNLDITTQTFRSTVQNSLEVNNEEPLNGEVRLDEVEEIRNNALNFYATQNRAVSLLDYQSIIYAMPSDFGKIKKCFITQDQNSFKRNLNIYVISIDNLSNLTTANQIVKSNLKTWLSRYKMINDTIDILDARIVNFGIDFNITIDNAFDRMEVYNRALLELQLLFTDTKMEIGESISIANIYNTLNKVNGVIDTTKVSITQKFGGLYSTNVIDLNSLTTFDGKYINCPKNVIYEVKFAALDIKGTMS
jgi:hypothetical protein